MGASSSAATGVQSGATRRTARHAVACTPRSASDSGLARELAPPDDAAPRGSHLALISACARCNLACEIASA